MKFEIKRAKNGYILKFTDGDYVYAETEENELDTFRNFLNLLIDNIGPMENKYGHEVLRIVKLPGRKWEGKLKDLPKEQQKEIMWLFRELRELVEDI
jgi:hypothetical protein